ncbi:hypothetical protein MKS85_28410, partial [Pseudomonas sp. JL2]|uniref:hypothetical protein n=1 Tax=Pseudomonas sp. JL2 TaxID=2919942 RepID=UPI002862AC37
PVGASLLAMTAAHSAPPVQADRYREQARSHSFDRGVHRFYARHRAPVGASLLALTAAHSAPPVQADRYREQARSHSFDRRCSGLSKSYLVTLWYDDFCFL